jgi:hypothetical protein
MYYNINNTLSHNCLFNFVLGPRGNGKTYGCKEYGIKNFIKNDYQFLYIRRYKEELKNINKFFDDIKDRFNTDSLQVKGYNFMVNDRLAGQAVPLSTSKNLKSTSFPKVKLIIFDEFILDKGVYHYLPDEVTTFLELYETVARPGTKDFDVKVLFLSNSITVTNPYFMYFDIQLPYGKKFFKKNDILIEYVGDDEFKEKKKQTRFAKIIQGTQYADYAIDNQFLRDDKNFVQKKTARSEYYFTFVYMGTNYGVWIDYREGVITVSSDYDPSCRLVYAITTADHRPNTLLLKSVNKSVLFKNFIEQYKLGNVRFESINIKNIVYNVIKLSL